GAAGSRFKVVGWIAWGTWISARAPDIATPDRAINSKTAVANAPARKLRIIDPDTQGGERPGAGIGRELRGNFHPIRSGPMDPIVPTGRSPSDAPSDAASLPSR